MEKFYTDEKNAQIVIALLKKHGIRRVIASPGGTNVDFVASVQIDPWFEVYSGVDERHSAYIACGMAAESGEPVVLSCTGATASRNYISALTEAYYRKLPILAVTSSRVHSYLGQLCPQVVDRTVIQRDIARVSVRCPYVKDHDDFKYCVREANRAILELTRDGGGPAHIILETQYSSSFSTKTLPEVNAIHRVTPTTTDWPEIPSGAKVAVWIGSHGKFSPAVTNAIESFVANHNAIVLKDVTSGYFGNYAMNPSLIGGQGGSAYNPAHACLKADLMIHIGEMSGNYDSYELVGSATEVWRVSEDGEIRDLFNKLKYVFEMDEKTFFLHYSAGNGSDEFRKAWQARDNELRGKLPEIPFSNIWMAQRLRSKLPQGSRIHLGILNSLRSWNIVDLPSGVQGFSNVGGFGIDGVTSTLIGASLVEPQKLYFGVTGDLAFFYDINSLGNRHIGNNVRILLINNGCGVEFKIHPSYAYQLGERTNEYIAAARHFGNKSRELVKHYAEDLGFKYLTASSKEEFDTVVNSFVDPILDKPIVFECFTEAKDEAAALYAVQQVAAYNDVKCNAIRHTMASVMPDRIKRAIKEFMK